MRSRYRLFLLIPALIYAGSAPSNAADGGAYRSDLEIVGQSLAAQPGGFRPDVRVQELNSPEFQAEGSTIVLADATYLDQLRLMSQIMAHDKALPVNQLVAEVMLDGVDSVAARRLSDQDWRAPGNPLADAMFRGAIAFLIGHEMGHLAHKDGPPSQAWTFQPAGQPGFTEARRRTCDFLLNSGDRADKAMEKSADEYSLALVSGVRSPNTGRLRYDLGIFFLFNVEHNRAVDALSGVAPAGLDIPGVDPQVAKRLRQRFTGNPGFVESTFPTGYSAWIERLFDVMDGLTRVQGSMFGSDPDFAQDHDTFEKIKAKICAG